MATNGTSPKVTLYTNHGCPYAHRAHITLKELGIPYDEVIIDLETPREPWYLEVNPRGLVPSIKYGDEIITESAIVAQFFADLQPSSFLPGTGNAKDALTRARINFFVDTWNTKLGSTWFKILLAEGEESEKLTKEFLGVVEREIEPLLANASPFFGGSAKMTLAEAITAPFVLRFYRISAHGILPKSLGEGLDKLPNFSKWAKEVLKQESVTYIWDEEKIIARTRARLEKMKAANK